MKKIFLATLILITLLLLAGCDTGSGSASTTPSNNKTPAHVHAFGEWQTVIEPTCDEKGLEERVCECGEKEEHKLPSLDHVYTPNVTEPTCTEGGYTTYVCVCGKSRTGDYTEKRGHDFTDFVTITAPTCTTEGEEARSCKNCPFSVTRKISATEHDFGEPVELSAPTCEAAGSYKRECKKCSHFEYFSSPALEHSFGDWYVSVSATCTEYGEERRKCQNTGCTKYELRYIRNTGHSFGEWATVSEPTCIEDGEKRSSCSNCSEYKAEILPAHGKHSFSEWITVSEPICGNVGTRTRTCSVCSSTQTGTVSPSESHSYGSWYKDSPSTMRRNCSKCSSYEMKRTSFSTTATVTVGVTITNELYEGTSSTVPYRRQGGCFNGINAYQALITQSEETGRIMKKNVLTGETIFSETVYLGHANNMFYLPTTNCVYVGQGSTHYVFDADTLEYLGKQRLGESTGCLYYLSESNTYINSSGTIYDSNFKIIGHITKESEGAVGKTVQGHSADANYIYELRCQSLGYDSKYYTYIRIHTTEGKYVTTVTVEIPENFEPENISVVNGELYIATCTKQPVVTFYKVVFE